MKKGWMTWLCALGLASATYLAFAQADHQVEDKGYINIGSYQETATKKRPAGSLYRGSGIVTFVGKPPKPFIQHDMGGYELDPAPAADRNKPYNHHDFGGGSWEFIVTGSRRPVPLTAKGRELMKDHITDNDVPRVGKPSNDPELVCDPLGYPRILFRNTRPFEVIQLTKYTLFHHQWHESWQKIWTDGRLLPKQPIDPAYMGYSVGKWVGDTFVVDTNGVNENAWFDTGGQAHTLQAEYQARWRRIDHNTLQMNLTIKDPIVYTEPSWERPTTLFQLYPNLEIDIQPCVPSEELLYRSNTPTELPDAGAKK